MEVKTGTLRNGLSRYLKRVRQTGNTITVLDRDVPIAEIRPYSAGMAPTSVDIWTRRTHFEERSGILEDDFELPERETDQRKQQNPLDFA